MKRRLVFLVMLTFIVAFGLILVGCDDGATGSIIANDGSLDGIWQNGSYTFEINGVNYSWKGFGENISRGIITYDISTFTMTSTDVWDGEKWIPFTDTVT